MFRIFGIVFLLLLLASVAEAQIRKEQVENGTFALTITTTAGDDPTVDDDNTQGHAVRSIWINDQGTAGDTSDDTMWIALSVATGAARWIQIAGPSASGLDANFDVEKEINGANSFANAFKISDGTGNKTAIYTHASNGPLVVGVCGGVENDCDYFRQLAANKKWGAKNSGGTEIFTVTENTGAITNAKLDSAGSGNDITLPLYWQRQLVACVSATASHIMDVGILSAPTPTCHTGTNRVTGSASFPDSDGDFGYMSSEDLPSGTFNSLDVKIWWWTSATTNSVVFQFATKCYAADEADDAAFNTASTVTDAAGGNASRPNTATITNVDITGCAAGELMRWKFFRNRTHASDSLAAALNVEKIVLIPKVTH